MRNNKFNSEGKGGIAYCSVSFTLFKSSGFGEKHASRVMNPESKGGQLPGIKLMILGLFVLYLSAVFNHDKHSFLLKSFHSLGFCEPSEELKITWEKSFLPYLSCSFFFLPLLALKFSQHQAYLLPFLFLIPLIIPIPITQCLSLSLIFLVLVLYF